MDNAELNDELEALEAIFSTDLKGMIKVTRIDFNSGKRQVNNRAHLIANTGRSF